MRCTCSSSASRSSMLRNLLVTTSSHACGSGGGGGSHRQSVGSGEILLGAYTQAPHPARMLGRAVCSPWARHTANMTANPSSKKMHS